MANIIDNLNTLNTNLDNTKFKIAKNLKDKGVQALPSDKLDILADKIVDIPSGSCNLQELNVTENGTYTPQAGDVKGYNKVTVNVPNSGGGEINWAALGYNLTPEEVTKYDDGYGYAIFIHKNWDAKQNNLSNKFYDPMNDMGDEKLVIMPYVDTHNATDMSNMFHGCINLTSVQELDTTKVDKMNDMFKGCSSLKIAPYLNFHNRPQFMVVDMSGLFAKCQNLTLVPQLETKHSFKLGWLFEDCENLEYIPTIDLTGVTDVRNMFKNCLKLKQIHFTGNPSRILDKMDPSEYQNMFYGINPQGTIYAPAKFQSEYRDTVGRQLQDLNLLDDFNGWRFVFYIEK